MAPLRMGEVAGQTGPATTASFRLRQVRIAAERTVADESSG
jgi:hypothetical protein